MFDRDQSGTIELHEFQGLWNYLSQWRALFDQFDRDKSGNIDAGELTTGAYLDNCSSTHQRCTDNALADYRRQIIGRLSADYRLFISGRIFVQ